jgi:hypothetical protein
MSNGKTCAAELKMKPRSLSCERKKSGSSCYLEVTPSGCENGCKVKYVGASDPYGPVNVRSSMVTIYGPSANYANLNCSSNWKVYFDDDQNTKYDCNGGQINSSSSKSVSSSSANKTPKLISCKKKNWDSYYSSNRALEIKAENCEKGCTINMQGSERNKVYTDIIYNSTTIWDFSQKNYDVWLNDGVKMSCSF